MWQYQALLVAHLLCAILWLGPDLVSWYVAWILRRPRFDRRVGVRVRLAGAVFFDEGERHVRRQL